ncbi:DUF5801 repeats-in-toxin domain-containing protein, partial [Aeromonas rivipollensis]|uniref:DUF5801 repeats-in-toxin domain-containing protein n=2 Tax=Aeromonas rivipollensis TaxID=948519 RepID=UPI002DD42626
HGNTGSHDDSVSLTLNSGVLTLVQTVTDADGDNAKASIDLGVNGTFRFEDDGPTAGLAGEAPSLGSVKVDESLPALGGVGGDGIVSATLAAATVQAQFSHAFGADGAGNIGYNLALNGSNVASGLYAVDPLAANGQGTQIVLNQVGNVITGSANGVSYFTLTIDPATGAVTLNLLDNVWHGNTGSHDDSVSLTLNSGVLTLVQTVTDADGDNAKASIDLGTGGVFRFEDDGPTAGLAGEAPSLGSVKVDESLPALGGVGGDGIVSATLAAATVQAQFSHAFGADGAGNIGYNLALTGSNVASGLYAVDPLAANGQGTQIVLNQVGNVITGSANGVSYFTLTIDPATGAVTLKLLDNVWHGNTGSHDDSVSLTLNSGVLTLVQTVTDADGDNAKASIDLGSGGVFRFEDDGPTAGLATQAPSLGSVKVDESLPALGGVGGDGIVSATLAAATVQAQFSNAFGADGAGNIGYNLALTGSNVASGLYAVDPLAANGQGTQIVLNQVGNVITGSANGVSYFTLTIDPATGAVTLKLLDNVWHGNTGNHDDSVSLTLNSGVLTLVQTVTDADGDNAKASIDLGSGGVFRFEDDGPVQSGNGQGPTVHGSVQEDALTLAGGAPHEGNHEGPGQTTTVSDTSGSLNTLVEFGADGPGVFSLSNNVSSLVSQGLSSGGVALSYSVAGNVLTATAGGTVIFTLTVAADGDYSFTLKGPLDHPVKEGLPNGDNELLPVPVDFSGVLVATDGDGDRVQGFTKGSFVIDVQDDIPVAQDDYATVLAGQSQNINMVFVLDFSGSIDNSELNIMLDAVRTAGQALFNTSGGQVKIQIVAFSGDSIAYLPTDNVTAFTNLVNSLNPQEPGGIRPFNGSTDFTDAIEQTMISYTPIPGWSNQVVFISDGDPNEQTGPGGASLTNTVATNWNNFVDTNLVNVTTIGIGNGINDVRLQEVDLDAGPNNLPLRVNNFSDLVNTLLNQVIGGLVQGNVLSGSNNVVGGGDDDAYGADGPGYIQSIKIGATTYSWDGVLDGDQQLTAVTTPAGGKLSFNFSTGAWSYQAPANVNGDLTEDFQYMLIDKDGDPATATLHLYVEDVGSVEAYVDEDELPSGITDSDSVTNSVSGTVAPLIVGPDNSATISLNTNTSGVTPASSGGVALVYTVVGDTLTATANGATVFTLQVGSNGSYQFNLVKSLDHPLGNGDDNELLTLDFTSILKATGGTGTLAGSFLIHVEDDVPMANNDADSAVEGVFTPVTGNVITGLGTTGGAGGAGADVKGADDAAVSQVVGFNGSTDSNASGGFTVTGQYGNLTMGPDGEYSYTLTATSVPVGATDVFTYTLKDGDNDTDPATLTINIGQDTRTPVLTIGNATVDEEGLPVRGSEPAGSAAVGNSEIFTGSFTVNTQGENLTALTIGGGAYNLVSGGSQTLVDNAQGTLVVTGVTGPSGGPFSVNYTYTLKDNVLTHSVQGDDDTVNGPLFVVSATDATGDVGTGNLQVVISDDAPTANAVTNAGQATQVQNTNLMLILDISGSMDESSGYQGMSRLQVMQKSALELLDKYSAYGNVMVNIITFATLASNPTGTWVSVDAAKTIILGLSSTDSTNYDDALNDAINAFAASNKIVGAQNVSYFMSDGLPNASNVSNPATVPDGANSLGDGDGISAANEKDWTDFLTANNINSFALGMGSGATQSALNPIAYNGVSGASPANTTAVVVTDFSQLAATLLSTVVAPPLSGQLIDGITASTGADGGWVNSITVAGVTYTYNQKTDSASSNTAAGTFNTTTNEWSITVAGGILKVDMDNGVYTYTPPSSIPVGGINQSFGYSVIDNDGDTASSTLSIIVNPAVGPTVVRDDFIITNQDPSTIPDWALLVNDTGPLAATQTIIGVSGAVSGTVTDNVGSVTFDDTSGNITPNTYQGSFNYTNSTTSDTAKVFVDVQGGTLTGSYLDEILIGGSGDETLNGNAGNDILLGGGGNDGLNGGEGNDILVGGAGNDTLNGGAGNDTASYIDITGGVGVTVIVNGNNQATGGAGTDSLSNMENLVGSMFGDTLTGDGSANILSGLAGNDSLTGGGGDDLLIGGMGSDTLTGNAGKDTFKWQAGDAGGTDTIIDFTTGANGDVLDLSELLSGEHANAASLDQYLNFASGPGVNKSTLTIDLDGSGSGTTTHSIFFDNVDLTANSTRTDLQIIQDLLNQGNLKVDP